MMEDRNKDILNMRLNGNTFREIAKKYGISDTRCSQIYWREFNKMMIARNNALYEKKQALLTESDVMKKLKISKEKLKKLVDYMLRKDCHV